MKHVEVVELTTLVGGVRIHGAFFRRAYHSCHFLTFPFGLLRRCFPLYAFHDIRN